MKILLTEEEMINVVSALDEENIKHYSYGKHKMWMAKKTEDGYELDYRYDSEGNVKPSYKTKNLEGKHG